MLMTVQEMHKRLDAGEDPLDLVEEKWKRLKAYAEKKGLKDVIGDNFRVDTCAFCSLFMHRGETWSGHRRCWQCPYMIVRGTSCDETHPDPTDYAPFDREIDTSEPWCEIATAFGSWPYSLEEGRRSRFISGCDKMLAVIDEIRNGTKKEDL